MKLPIRTLAILALGATMGVALSGCIVYVSPDKDHNYHHGTMHQTPASSDEKPADTVDKSPA